MDTVLLRSMSTGTDIAHGGTQRLNDVVDGPVDYEGRPVYRSQSGGWKSSSFIICESQIANPDSFTTSKFDISSINLR